jgi:hypothetical protein
MCPCCRQCRCNPGLSAFSPFDDRWVPYILGGSALALAYMWFKYK